MVTLLSFGLMIPQGRRGDNLRKVEWGLSRERAAVRLQLNRREGSAPSVPVCGGGSLGGAVKTAPNKPVENGQ